jgi:regulator of sirC expression with transglutaminase-like and TPR domain
MTASRAKIERALGAIGAGADAAIDLAEAALLFAALDRGDGALDPYRAHLAEIARDVGAAVPPGAARNIARQARALARVMSDTHRYVGDTLTYDDPQNASLMRVIDRRKGLPVALAILYIHAARAQGWAATGINFPGHFLIRLESRGARVILDPFNGGVEREVADLRALLKQMAGLDAELRPEHYAPIGNRDTLVRLLNNIKLRAASAGDDRRAAEMVDRMLLIAPDELALLREAGMCHARLGNLRRATEALRGFIARSADGAEKREAESLLRQVRARLN